MHLIACHAKHLDVLLSIHTLVSCATIDNYPWVRAIYVPLYDYVQQQLSIRTSESPGHDEGWEYARKPHLPYHPEPGKLCMARRRRWLRKLVPASKQAELSEKRPTFQFASKVCGL